MSNLDSSSTPQLSVPPLSATGEAPRHPWRRMVSLGDSFTEGIGDPDPQSPGGHRGWADRMAEQLSREVEDFAYANLAIRGRLLDQIHEEQLEPALALQPDLITICAGGNDVLRPGGDPDALAVIMDRFIGELSATGATLLLFNGPDIGETPVLGSMRGRVAIYNENLRAIGARHDAVIADMWAMRELHEARMWAPDRLHFSPLGHHTIAMMALNALNVEHELTALEPSPSEPKPWRVARREDLVWARTHLAPWVLRRLRHQSSGDGITAKRPQAMPFSTGGTTRGVGAGDPRNEAD
ncbi:SGNH/GDSL hydrolase family protein [Arthrobacter rhombi]|uniref:Probable secreted protein n=2 Tax=Micrococcaceae TaxID=1268 RepID=A0A1R4F3J5_9MICC|nr:probable secreted protein [Arthrobacter rhombi]